MIEDRKAQLARRESQAVFEERNENLLFLESSGGPGSDRRRGNQRTGGEGLHHRPLGQKRDQLKVVAYQGLTQKYLEKGPIDPARSLSGMVQSGQDLYIQDVTQDTRVQYPEEAREEGIKSILSVPLLVKQELIGALRIYSASTHQFSAEEFKFLHALADQASLAIENARSYEDMKSKYEALRGNLVDYFEDGWT